MTRNPLGSRASSAAERRQPLAPGVSRGTDDATTLSLSAQAGGKRRGTVLILALGVLAILSVAALSYVTVVRLERSNVAVAVAGSNYNVPADQVVDTMGAILTADLFGNKIVTRDDVAPPGTLFRNGPSMFEDGDARDVPTLEISTFNSTLNPSDPPPVDSTIPINLNPPVSDPAKPDDAFLAATEPEWVAPPNLNTTFRWPQITNLRSAYTFDRAGRQWVRGDGRFVDLATWFLAPTNNGYANPSINLVDWLQVPASLQPDLGPDAGINQDVYNKQMNDMNGLSPATLGSIRPSDERRWADTDGDLRPDARWTVIDGMNVGSKLKWVVAARIIDASALININAAVEFGGANAYPVAGMLGDGRTPADIDLPRFLQDMRRTPSTTPTPFALQVETDRLFGNPFAYSNHLLDGLGLGLVVEDAGLPTLLLWQSDTPSTPTQRAEFWNLFGQNSLQPSALGKRGVGYPIRDLTDLAAFWGTNNAGFVSRIEQFIDGTETSGYLPNDTTVPNSYGPMRSKEGVQGVSDAASIRRLMRVGESDPNTFALPNPMQVHDSVRRLLTPVSGVGLQSPVPVLNPFGFAGQYATRKVRIDGPQTAADTRNAFQALVWALAPLATNQPMSAEAKAADVGNGFGVESEDAHYGGYSNTSDQLGGTYRSLARHLYPPESDLNGDGTPDNTPPLASFVAITAASIAANLADATDTDTVAGLRPTVVSLYNDTAQRSTGAFGSIPLGTRLAQGDIPPGSLPWVDSANPYLIVGLDRQPFLREVTVIAVYTDATSDINSMGMAIGDGDSATGPSEPEEALGSAVRVVLTNPWSQPIQIGPQYNVVIPETLDLIDDPMTDPAMIPASGPFRMTLPVTTILAGQSMGFLWILPSTGDAWDAIHTEIRLKPDFTGLETISTISPSPDIATRVPFGHLLTTPEARGVLLTYVDPVATLPELVIDRMRPSGSVGFPEFKSNSFDFRNTSASPNVPDNFPLGFSPSNFYFLGLDWDPAALAGDPRWNGGASPGLTGRMIHTACLSRPTSQRNNGMSAVVIEDPSKNNVTQVQDALAWFVLPGATNNEDQLRLRPDTIVKDFGGVTGIDFPNKHVRGFASGDSTFADLATPLPYGNATADDLPVFQLFVPDAPLITASDMLRIGIFAHTCKDCGDLAGANNLQNWRTVGEKLGATLEIDNADMSLNNSPNAYLGVLDPTRYVPNFDLNLTGWASPPDTIKLPLALRVPDCFEASPVETQLVQGRININTAPKEVLGALPLVEPRYAIDLPPNAPIGASTLRRDLIDAYREPNRTAELGLVGFDTAGLPQGLRPATTANAASNRGFVTPAELAVLGNWEVLPGGLSGNPTATQPGTFLELAADNRPNDFSPLQHQEYVDAAGLYPAAARVNPVDDPEERLALYRAVSNIATTRSDVFIAWFVMRAYDPQAVEQINVRSDNPSEARAVEVMDAADSNFQPVHESRWLVVFDRSQTEDGSPLDQPTERPRVLMKVQLPSAKP